MRLKSIVCIDFNPYLFQGWRELMSWTDERVSLLTKLWGEGHTAAEIAKKLGGVTRNAVIGKAHRLKLSSRISPIQQNKKPANKNVDRKAKNKASVLPSDSAPIQVLAVEKEKEKPKISKVVSVPKDEVKKDGLYNLMDLKPRMCRWPCGDPKHEDFGFCGGNSMPGLPYCEDHARIAYQAATRNRIFNTDKEVKKIREQLEAFEETKKVASN